MSWRYWVAFAGVCLLALFLRAPLASLPLERDEGSYAYVAQRWMRGEIPYRDSFDHKPPGLYVAYAVIQRLAGPSPAAIHWGAQVYTLGTLAVLFVLGWRLASPAAGLAAAAFAAFMTADCTVLGNAANAEVFMILPLAGAVLAVLAAIRRDSLWWAFASGMLGAAAVLCKQAAVPELAFVLGVLVWRAPRRIPGVLVWLLGVASGVVPAVVYFALHGALMDLYDGTIGHNLQYQRRVPFSMYPGLFWAEYARHLGSTWPIVLLAAVPVIVPGTRGRGGAGQRPAPRDTLLVVAWLGAALAGVAGGGYFRPHYFIQLVPPLAVLAGMGVAVLATRPAVQVACVAAALAIGIANNAWYYLPADGDAKMRRLYATNPFVESPAVARYLAAHSEPDDRVFILGSEPQILYYAQRRSASRYIFVYPLTGPFRDARVRQQEALREIEARAPRFIVTVHLQASFATEPDTPPDLRDGLTRLVEQSYALTAVVPYSRDAAPQVLDGEAATDVWQRAPFACCSMALWQRVSAG